MLLTDRSWLFGFGLEGAGFALYVVALALAPLTLVQSIAAGGIGILALASARMSRRRLGRHELPGVFVSILGLLALAVSLAGGGPPRERRLGGGDPDLVHGDGGRGRRRDRPRPEASAPSRSPEGIAGGLLFSIGDISVKVATQGDARAAFAITVSSGTRSGPRSCSSATSTAPR